jgi:hypothetical protein
MPKLRPLPPVRYSVHKRILGRYNRLFSMYQQLLEENNELRMKLAARPTKHDDGQTTDSAKCRVCARNQGTTCAPESGLQDC